MIFIRVILFGSNKYNLLLEIKKEKCDLWKYYCVNYFFLSMLMNCKDIFDFKFY